MSVSSGLCLRATRYQTAILFNRRGPAAAYPFGVFALVREHRMRRTAAAATRILIILSLAVNMSASLKLGVGSQNETGLEVSRLD